MITTRHLVKEFGPFHALGPLDLTIGTEQIVAVLGPSGCGKSTLLRLLAGLETPSRGTMSLDGSAIEGPQEKIGVAFQDPRLMPWLTVRENIALGIWDWPRDRIGPAVEAVIARVGLSRFSDALPKSLSGGMAQRVGLARALVGNPRLLLLDEPFGALDPLTRIRMQDHLLDLVDASIPNVLLITHDVDEALVLSDRVILLDGPPARIRRDLRVDLPKPRNRTSPDFQELKNLLLGDLLPGHGDPHPLPRTERAHHAP
ncbi:ABC transporter ATP-binding protein [Celeribacter indicus]|uniref:ABC transporter-like protein n=1 Tax=Celeribacter indicus TaxID=1208324 RepID=A0A0B5DYC3_9RHOB|nr:ABC transporter ATP-binding protein [Celeribacter indicus]AJE46155.1 ABC transporter-like protein [Celeribacter indicus]SDX36678.1 sulfonate transport system ATP-binding protein [Celeribacter indicus]